MDNTRSYEMPMEHLHLSHQQVHLDVYDASSQDISSAPITERESLHDTSQSSLEFSISSSKLQPDEQESENAPFFAGACAGIITLLILFLWNQSMRIRSLMKHKAGDIETEVRVWGGRRNGGDCRDEEQGNPKIQATTGRRRHTLRDVRDSGSESILEESCMEMDFRSPLFPSSSDLEDSSTGSLYAIESGIANHSKNYSDVSGKCTGSGSCEEVTHDGASLSAAESYCGKAKTVISRQYVSPCLKAPQNHVLGTAYDFEETEWPKPTAVRSGTECGSWRSLEELYEVEEHNSFRQISTLDSIFGTVQAAKSIKPGKKCLNNTFEKQSQDYKSTSTTSGTFVDVKEYDSSEQHRRLETGQLTKTNGFMAEDDYDRNSLRSGIPRNDFDSDSDCSLAEQALHDSRELEADISGIDSLVEKEEVMNFNKLQRNQSREYQERATDVSPALPNSRKTRLHEWLINQRQHKDDFLFTSMGLMDVNRKERIQLKSSNDNISQEYRVKTSCCLDGAAARDRQGSPMRDDDKRRPHRARRNVSRNRKTKPAIDYKRKSENIRREILSPDLRIVANKDYSFYRDEEIKGTSIAKRILCNGSDERNEEAYVESVVNLASISEVSRELEESAGTNKEMTTAANSLRHAVFFDRPVQSRDLDIELPRQFSETRMNPESLLEELQQRLTSRSTEQKAETVLPKSIRKKKEHSNSLVEELKEELSHRKSIPVTNKRGREPRTRPTGFVEELKEALESRATHLMRNKRPLPVDKGPRNVGQASNDLICELKHYLSIRKKRDVNYDFSAAESKYRSNTFKNESKLITELRKKLADRRQKNRDPDESTTDMTPSQTSTNAYELVASSIADDGRESMEGATMELNSSCRESDATDTMDPSDRDGNMSTVSELGEHSAAFTNPSKFWNPDIEHCDSEKALLPLIVTMRTEVKDDGNTYENARERSEDPFKELSRLNQILESDSDSESTLSHPDGANKVIESLSDVEAGLEGNSKYPWKSAGGAAKNSRSRRNQMLVFDFVAPGNTPTGRGSTDIDLLSRYKDDILKERRKLRSTDRSVNCDQSISSMPSYKARMFPTKKENPEGIPWWLPDETDSKTSSDVTGMGHDTVREIVNSSSSEDNETYESSSSDARTNSTNSSFLTKVLLKQRQTLQ